jgi:hypothetical protein
MGLGVSAGFMLGMSYEVTRSDWRFVAGILLGFAALGAFHRALKVNAL